MLDNMVRQWTLQARTAGVVSPLIEQAQKGDHRPLFRALLMRSASSKGEPFGMQAAEMMRMTRANFPTE
jgi:hypothetical protein